MTYAIPSDVAQELRGSTSVSTTEAVQWQAWLDRIERSIERGFRRRGLVLSERVALGDPSADDVKDIEVAAVVRKVQNPQWGQTSTTRTVDDGTITTRREGAGSAADPLDLLPEDWSVLLPTESSGAFSVRPSFEPDAAPWPLDWT